MTEGLNDPRCLCCCRLLSEHNHKRQCPETVYFIENKAAAPDPALAAMREAFARQTELVGRLCDAVDREAEDIGGESSLTVLRLLGPHHSVCLAALASGGEGAHG